MLHHLLHRFPYIFYIKMEFNQKLIDWCPNVGWGRTAMFGVKLWHYRTMYQIATLLSATFCHFPVYSFNFNQKRMSSRNEQFYPPSDFDPGEMCSATPKDTEMCFATLRDTD